ncbi:MAG: DNA adenine methylase [Phycisphaerae bacterium]|nr:DNA adenine methylase [Phycisphaerae bacterium]
MLRYPGGKFKARHVLHDLAPVKYSEYREPFLGGAGILWKVPANKRIWISDANPIIPKYWSALRDDDGFIDRQVEFAAWSKTLTEDEKLAAFESAKEPYALRDCPFAFWVLNRWSVSAVVSKDRGGIASFSPTFGRDGMDTANRPRLEGMRDFLSRPNLAITTGDYLPMLEAPGEDCWVFLDPPYPMKSAIYEYHWEWKQQEELAHHLRRCKHKWLLTNANCPRIRELYRGFHIRERRYTGSMLHKKRGKDWQFKTELIITNY